MQSYANQYYVPTDETAAQKSATSNQTRDEKVSAEEVASSQKSFTVTIKSAFSQTASIQLFTAAVFPKRFFFTIKKLTNLAYPEHLETTNTHLPIPTHFHAATSLAISVPYTHA